YPWGLFGKGYVVPSDEEVNKLKRTTKKLLIFNFFFLIFLMGPLKALGFPIFVLFVSIYLFGYYIWIQTITRKFEKTNEKISSHEVHTKQAHVYTYTDLILLSLVSVVFVVGGIVMIVTGKERGKGWLVTL